MRKNRKLWIQILVALAAVNLIVLFFLPNWMDEHAQPKDKIVTEGEGEARLSVSDKDRTFKGKGIFDPLEGVKAFNNNGKDMTDRIAVTYVSKESIQEKEIHYIVYDSKNKKLEDVCNLHLAGYKGPKIEIETLTSVSWEELQMLDQVLKEKGMIQADDGFGNDALSGVSYMFKLLPETKEAEITFSLINTFQDVWTEKFTVRVDDFPEDYDLG